MKLSENLALVTGSSGFIGSHLVNRLLSQGTRVLGVDIRPPAISMDGYEHLQSDVRDLSSLKRGGVSTIYNLAAVHTTPGHPDCEYYDTNVSGALAVSEFAERNMVNDIIFTSSISVYGPSEEVKAEDSLPAPVSAYGKSKLMAEGVHRAWQRGGAQRRLVVVRPAVVFGQGEGGNFTRLARLLSKGVFVYPGRRDTVKSCIYVHDLLDVFEFLHSRGASYEIANGCYPNPLTLEEIVDTLRELHFRNVKTFDVPKALIISAAVALSALDGLGIGVHPDRVRKLMNSTNIAPTWASESGFFRNRDTRSGLVRWMDATEARFD